MVVEYVLTCFRSRVPDLSLDPVVLGPLAAPAPSASVRVAEVVEIVATRFWRTDGDGADQDQPRDGGAPGV